MLRMFLSVMLILAPLGVGAQSDPRTAALDDKPGLEKPITLSMRAASLRQVLGKVEAQTGVKLRCTRGIAEDKASVWVKNRAAREVLRALAHCFNLCWSDTEIDRTKVLLLGMDRDYHAELSRRRYEDYRAIVRQFDTELETAAEFIRSGQRYEPSQDELRLVPNPDERERLRRRSWLTQYPEFAAMTLQCLNLSETQKKDLLEGKVVVVSGHAIAQEAVERCPEARSFSYWVEPSLAGYLLYGSRPTTESDYLLLAAALFDDSRHYKAVRSANEALLKDPVLDRELPAPKQQEGPSPQPDGVPPTTQAIPGDVDASQNDGRTPSGRLPDVPRPGEGSGATPTTMSDALLPIAEAAEIPTVAQYLSEYASSQAVPERSAQEPEGGAAKKVGQRLADLCNQHLFVVERDGDFLLAKSLLWHRLREREVPEKKIKQWQSEITGLPAPTFDVAVEMGSMSWGQLRGIISNSLHWFGIPSLPNIARCEHALKLYASLTPNQRRALSQGAEILMSTLKPEQQRFFMQMYEHKTRPTYKDAQDPNWPQVATFSLFDQGFARDTLYARAQMRSLGWANLDTFISRERRAEEEELMTPERARRFREMLRRNAQEYIPERARALAKRVGAEHPQVPPRSIEIYALRQILFRIRLGEQQGTDYLRYSTRVAR